MVMYPSAYALVSSQPITSSFGFVSTPSSSSLSPMHDIPFLSLYSKECFIDIFQKGSPLVEDMSREIARIRLDGALDVKLKQSRLLLGSIVTQTQVGNFRVV
uniref:Uncharacterized protein n=1 Tax=Lactuca sativa TaxID=4236 RepID=A0A9R1UPT6_LACSA|nr:hypothetical protein LSAT_V11C800427590 [Lactuca sativa]